MSPTIPAGIAVIDFRRQSMVLQWIPASGTWTAYDEPPGLVYGVALIRAAQPAICLFARDGRLHLQIGTDQQVLLDHTPRVKWSRGSATFGLRRRLTVESSNGTVLSSHACWNSQGDEFFSWLVARTADHEWRTANERRWSQGVQPAVLRGS